MKSVSAVNETKNKITVTFNRKFVTGEAVTTSGTPGNKDFYKVKLGEDDVAITSVSTPNVGENTVTLTVTAMEKAGTLKVNGVTAADVNDFRTKTALSKSIVTFSAGTDGAISTVAITVPKLDETKKVYQAGNFKIQVDGADLTDATFEVKAGDTANEIAAAIATALNGKTLADWDLDGIDVTDNVVTITSTTAEQVDPTITIVDAE